MNESKKEHQCQIRITHKQYQYLQQMKQQRKCNTSAYFRSLLIADMTNTQQGGVQS